MRNTDEFLTHIIVALARTWDNKLPGFREEFKEHLAASYMLVGPTKLEVRNAMDRLIRHLGDE